MSTAAARFRKQLPRLKLSHAKGSEIAGMLLSAAVVLMAGCLLSYHPLDPSVLHRVAEEGARTRNLVGPAGANLAALTFAFLGLVAFVVPVFLGALAWRRLARHDAERVSGRTLGLLAVIVALPAMLQLLAGEVTWRSEPLQAGGALGVVVTDMLTTRLNSGGSFVILLTILLVGGSLAMSSTLGELLELGKRRAAMVGERLLLTRARRRKRREERAAHKRVIRHARRAAGGATAGAPAAARRPPVASRRKRAEASRRKRAEVNQVRTEGRDDAGHDRALIDLRIVERKGQSPFAVRRVRSQESDPDAGPRRSGAGEPGTSKKGTGSRQAASGQKALGFRPEELAPTELPPVNLLCTDATARAHDEAELVRLGHVIRDSAAHFGIDGTIEGISPGPVITVFEFQPAPGIKVSRIVSLQDDIALALKAESVRIERLPGRSTLGVEVPNDRRSIIHLGHLFADEKFKRSPSPLTVALGVDIYGRPFCADLATMPHLLVAGATGAGKSVGLQSMITSIIYKSTRDEVKFIFIDPKRIELGVYGDIPHLKTEVVVDPKKAANALRWAVAEMERRYRLLAELHVRSIDYYNRAIRDPGERKRLSLKEGESDLEPEDWKPLPYYVIVIDELADLMMVASSDVETSIARLAQMARAVGIHLIVATQRPSVDVLTGTIKANFPCRLSYATATRHDSRTILDQVGAERLLGKGDALFMAPGTSRVLRMHGAYISEQETAALIRWLKRHGKPDIDLDVLKAPEKSNGSGSAGGGDDELFDEAARLVVSERMGSASYLQRRLRVGFSRAARLIDMLEADGLLGPAQGSKPREVLVKPDYFEEIDRGRSES